MILVVGGAGYIGSHLLLHLRRAGLSHCVFDNLENGHATALQGSPLFRGDVRMPDELRRCFTENPEIDVVMHFAAYISVGESVRDPSNYWRNNVFGTMNLMDAMVEAGVNKLVFSSTAAIFGDPLYTPIDEEHPKNPTSPYGNSKLAIERLLGDFDSAAGIKSVCLRYFNAAGADPGGEIGEDHDPEEHLIPVALQTAMGQRPPLTVFGSDYDTPDGTCVRDYVHVSDLAGAHLLALEHLRKGGESRQYNIGSGEGFSVCQVLDAVSRVVGAPVPRKEGARRPGDPASLIASSAKIEADWCWKPKFPNLETIIEHAWTWHRTHPDGYPD